MKRPWKFMWTLLLPVPLLLVAVGASRFAATNATAATTAPFDEDFTPRTMRVDYYHSGTATEEHVALDRVVADGAWPGSRTQLVDPVNYGLYQFEVRDLESNRLLYSRGFSSVFGEWRTTSEAKQRWGTFHESLRFPWPKRAVQVALRVRGRDALWREIWTAAIDPASRAVNKADLAPRGTVWSVLDSGPPAQKVDLLILGDGYTAAEMEKFRADAKRLSGELFTVEPFRSRKSDFNVRAIDSPSSESGISRPHAGIFRRAPLGTHYSTFDSERYILTFDNRTLRDVASAAPYDFLVILVNERTYGGGGIYNDQTTVAASNGFARYLFIHEFGHHFAALGDEYYTSDVAYETGAAEKPEPWEPNVTALHDPAKLKWRDLVTPGVPLPTPWNKEEFEKLSIANQEVRRKLRAEGAPEEKLEALFREEREKMTKLLASSTHAGKVGAFEGAGYEAKGLYRPSTDCIMFTRDEVGFCAVCTRAIHRMIDAHTR
jgi:hypothetical protein